MWGGPKVPKSTVLSGPRADLESCDSYGIFSRPMLEGYMEPLVSPGWGVEWWFSKGFSHATPCLCRSFQPNMTPRIRVFLLLFLGALAVPAAPPTTSSLPCRAGESPATPRTRRQQQSSSSLRRSPRIASQDQKRAEEQDHGLYVPLEKSDDGGSFHYNGQTVYGWTEEAEYGGTLCGRAL